MRRGLAISAVGHAVLLVWLLASFSSRSVHVATESLPIDVVTTAEFTQITAGQKNAPQAEKPKPLVEKIAETKRVDDAKPKVAEKKEIVPTQPAAAPPSEAKPDPKPDKAKKEPDKLDQIAEALKKDEAKKPVKAEAKPAPKKQAREYTFDPNETAALLDKRKPQRQAAAGEALNTNATLGLSNTNAPALSQWELDALRRKIEGCWRVPAGARDAQKIVVTVEMRLRQDGTLAADPVVINRGSSPLFQIFAETALRAIRECQPYQLPLAKYDAWKEIELDFDPRDMFRG